MTHRFYPYKGKWTLQRIIKEIIKDNGGELPIENFLDCLHKMGYHRESVRIWLQTLGVEILDGVARLRR